MKKIVAMLLAAVMLLAMTVTVFADEGDSPEQNIIVSATDANGNDITDMLKVVTNTVSAEAKTELNDQKLSELLGTAYNKNIYVESVVDVIYTGTAYPVTITFRVENAKVGAPLYVLHKGSSGWERMDAVIGDKTVTVTFNSLSPVAFVMEKESPKTGNNATYIAVVALLSLVCAAYATRRSFNA